MLSDAFVALLVCPRSKQPLIYFPRGERDVDEADAFLVSPAARLRYPIEHGVPVLLVEEAEALTAEALHRLVERARQLGLPVPAGNGAP